MSARPTHLPLFPLNTVVFPGGRLPLQIFEPRYIDLVRTCLRENGEFGIVAIREGREAGTAAVPWGTGTSVRIVDWDQGANGLLNILVEGSDRFDILDTQVAPSQLIVAQVRWRAPLNEMAVTPAFMELKSIVDALLEKHGGVSAVTPLADAHDPVTFCYRLLDLMALEPAAKIPFLVLDQSELLLQAILDILREIPKGTARH